MLNFTQTVVSPQVELEALTMTLELPQCADMDWLYCEVECMEIPDTQNTQSSFLLPSQLGTEESRQVVSHGICTERPLIATTVIGS